MYILEGIHPERYTLLMSLDNYHIKELTFSFVDPLATSISRGKHLVVAKYSIAGSL